MISSPRNLPEVLEDYSRLTDPLFEWFAFLKKQGVSTIPGSTKCWEVSIPYKHPVAIIDKELFSNILLKLPLSVYKVAPFSESFEKGALLVNNVCEVYLHTKFDKDYIEYLVSKLPSSIEQDVSSAKPVYYFIEVVLVCSNPQVVRKTLKLYK